MFACNWAPSKYTATHPMAKRAMGCGFSLGFRVCALVASTQPRNHNTSVYGLTVKFSVEFRVQFTGHARALGKRKGLHGTCRTDKEMKKKNNGLHDTCLTDKVFVHQERVAQRWH